MQQGGHLSSEAFFVASPQFSLFQLGNVDDIPDTQPFPVLPHYYQVPLISILFNALIQVFPLLFQDCSVFEMEEKILDVVSTYAHSCLDTIYIT